MFSSCVTECISRKWGGEGGGDEQEKKKNVMKRKFDLKLRKKHESVIFVNFKN
jgi:hypothetical protein